MNYELLFAAGNIFFLCASFPNIVAALKNRAVLRGFSFTGALLTFFGMITTVVAYIFLNTTLNIILAMPTLTYWGLVAWYSRRV